MNLTTEGHCFACNKPLKEARHAQTSDDQNVYVGRECSRRISAMGIHGYQPPLGGPRLYMTMLPYCNHLEHQSK